MFLSTVESAGGVFSAAQHAEEAHLWYRVSVAQTPVSWCWSKTNGTASLPLYLLRDARQLHPTRERLIPDEINLGTLDIASSATVPRKAVNSRVRVAAALRAPRRHM